MQSCKELAFETSSQLVATLAANESAANGRNHDSIARFEHMAVCDMHNARGHTYNSC